MAGAVIASAVVLGLWLITASLRPLRRIEGTAAAIGAGDLSRRVEPDGGTTEIGRLGGALNAMLGQIEDAFAERAASEARLRRFISDASHELRTPVAAVSAYAELFDRGARDRPDDLERSMTGIQRETRRMGLLVSDLLLLARLDQGRPLEARPVDLTALAGEAVDAAHAMEPARPLALEAPAVVTVTGDAERLRQVIDNLLANVRAHTPATAAGHRARAARGRGRRARGRRCRAGHGRGGGRARLRALLPRRPLALARPRRRGPRPRDRGRDRRGARRHRRGREHARHGHDVPRDAARPRHVGPEAAQLGPGPN